MAIAVGLTACVTVNVNFPESAVQNATDDYVKELYKAKKENNSGNGTAPAKPTSELEQPVLQLIADSAWSALVPSAQAVDLVFDTSFPEAVAIRNEQAELRSKMENFEKLQVLGENKEGFMEVRDPQNKLKPGLKALAEKVVKDENDLRRKLYGAVTKHNADKKVPLKTVQENFARSFKNAAPSGYWLQDEKGNWYQAGGK